MTLQNLLQGYSEQQAAYIHQYLEEHPSNEFTENELVGIIDHFSSQPDFYDVNHMNRYVVALLVNEMRRRFEVATMPIQFHYLQTPITSDVWTPTILKIDYEGASRIFILSIATVHTLETLKSDLGRWEMGWDSYSDDTIDALIKTLQESTSETSMKRLRYYYWLGLIDSAVIPRNSDSLQVKEDSSRFSSAIWYEAIQQKVITLAGVGGIGSYVAYLLARMHPKSLFLYDDDLVEYANMSGQLYSKLDVGMTKVDAIAQMVSNYANYDSAFAVSQRFTESTEPSDIMICGFDNMAAIKLFFEKWLGLVKTRSAEDKKKCLFIDGRLAAEELQVLCITGDNEWAINTYREKYLFTDEQADATVCAYKQTTYMANLIGSLIVNLFVNFVANEVSGWEERDVPFFTSYDGLTMFLKCEK